jgi:hypothetical protein
MLSMTKISGKRTVYGWVIGLCSMMIGGEEIIFNQ